MATPPQLTPEQRTAALAKAAEARAARAELKNQLKNGSVTIREALASTSVDGRQAQGRFAARVAARASARSRRARSWKTSASPTTAAYRASAPYRSSHCSINSASEAMAASDGSADPLIIVISGPGGRRQGNDRQRTRRARPEPVVEQVVDDAHAAARRTRHAPTSSPITPSFEDRIDARRLSRVDQVPRQLLRHPDARCCRRARRRAGDRGRRRAARSRSCTATRS